MENNIEQRTESVFASRRNAVFFIAEIGGNHEGNFSYAKELTKLAIDSGADAVKFQFYSGDSLVSRVENSERNAHFKKFELSQEENLHLIQMIGRSEAYPMASVWNETMLSWANPKLPIHKVGSGDLTCYPMLELLAKTDKPIILSTGLSNLHEIESAVAYIESCNPSYISQRKLALLQCTSSYPTPDEDANIGAMLTLKREFGLPVGYSDHTLGSAAIEAAVAVGAEIIEKHFTDNREGKTFRDHLIALTSDEVRDSLVRMRRIKSLLGEGSKVLTKAEMESGHHISFRRSVYISRAVKAGETLTEDNLTVLRPFHGICASHYQDVLGRKVLRNLSEHQVVREEDLD